MEQPGVRFVLGLDCQIQAQNGEPGRVQLVQPPDRQIRREQLLHLPTKGDATDAQPI